MTRDDVEREIRAAFADVAQPPAWALTSSAEGDEPGLVANEFAGVSDWRKLDPAFLDQAPAGLASALSFFSDESFRFFLPAYLIADLNGALQRVSVTFHLTQGLDSSTARKLVNPERYGSRTWRDVAEHRFSVFSPAQARAITLFLQFKNSLDSDSAIADALTRYWLPRSGVRPN